MFPRASALSQALEARQGRKKIIRLNSPVLCFINKPTTAQEHSIENKQKICTSFFPRPLQSMIQGAITVNALLNPKEQSTGEAFQGFQYLTTTHQYEHKPGIRTQKHNFHLILDCVQLMCYTSGCFKCFCCSWVVSMVNSIPQIVRINCYLNHNIHQQEQFMEYTVQNLLSSYSSKRNFYAFSSIFLTFIFQVNLCFPLKEIHFCVFPTSSLYITSQFYYSTLSLLLHICFYQKNFLKVGKDASQPYRKVFFFFQTYVPNTSTIDQNSFYFTNIQKRYLIFNVFLSPTNLKKIWTRNLKSTECRPAVK